MQKIGFVIPWFGENIPGGAEMELREVTAHLQKAGMEVEILTTCVKEFTADWITTLEAENIELWIPAGMPMRSIFSRGSL